MIVYLVQVIDFTDIIQRTYNDSIWIDRTNAQCQSDRLNIDFDNHYEDCFAQVKQMKVQDYEVGRDVL